MNRAAGKRVWEAARDAGFKPLSWRKFVALTECNNRHGSHEANHGSVAYDLERDGLVELRYPYAFATVKGAELLTQIALRGTK